MEKELQLLAKCSINDASKILHVIVDKMCGRKPVISYSEFQQIWTLEEWWQMNKKYSETLKDGVKNQWTKSDVERILHCLPVDYQSAIHHCLISCHEEITQLLLNETCNISDSSLVDFDWQLKLAVGSDKMANIKKPIASIMLKTTSDENVVLEMSKEELSKFIATLEQANRAVSQLQT